MWTNPEEFRGPTTCRRLSRSFDDMELFRDDMLDNPNAIPVLLWISNAPLTYGNIRYAPVVLLCQETWEVGYLILDSTGMKKLEFHLEEGTRLVVKRFGILSRSEISSNWEEHAAKGMSELPAFSR
jgi:hypothetical protein